MIERLEGKNYLENINIDNKKRLKNIRKEFKEKIVGKIKNSRFLKLDKKEMLNYKTGDKVLCKYERINRKIQKLSIYDKNQELAYIKFIYELGVYYILKIESYKKGNGGFLLDLFLKTINKKLVYLIDEAEDKFSKVRLQDFYYKKGFRDSILLDLREEKVLFKNKDKYLNMIGIEQKIKYKIIG